jgi:hypothetical protein
LVDTTVAIAFAVSWKPLMYVEDQRRQEDEDEKRHGAPGQECLSATWTTMFRRCGTGRPPAPPSQKLLEDHELLGVAGPVVEAAQLLEHDLVGLALRVLQAVVGLADRLEVVPGGAASP